MIVFFALQRRTSTPKKAEETFLASPPQLDLDVIESSDEDDEEL